VPLQGQQLAQRALLQARQVPPAVAQQVVHRAVARQAVVQRAEAGAAAAHLLETGEKCSTHWDFPQLIQCDQSELFTLSSTAAVLLSGHSING